MNEQGQTYFGTVEPVNSAHAAAYALAEYELLAERHRLLGDIKNAAYEAKIKEMRNAEDR